MLQIIDHNLVHYHMENIVQHWSILKVAM